MEGYIIRFDGIDEHPIEVISRDYTYKLPSMGNINQEYKHIKCTLDCSHTNAENVLKELEKEYSLRKVHCGCSGCCQYATFGYYLD